LAQKQDNAMQPGYYQNRTVMKTGVTRTFARQLGRL
jgi:hypothetical protein